MIRILPDLWIPRSELRFSASRSSGPGGQHANKVSSRVELRYDVRNSPSLTETRRRRIESRLASRITGAGVLRMVCQRHRSQAANRDFLLLRFAELLREALKRRPPRRSTVPNRSAIERRLRRKRRRSDLKAVRSRRPEDD